MQSECIIDTLNKSLTADSCENTENEFYERLQTYIDGQKWIKKPLSLSPTICSQYGWKCIKSDLLECITCSAKLCTHEPKIQNYTAYKACIEKMRNDLKHNHGKHCPWPLTPSPENFVRMVLMPKEKALSQFLKRLKSSLSFCSSMPKIKESTFIDLDFSDLQIASLCKLGGISSEETSHFGKSLVCLAATGWNVTEGSDSKKTVYKCNSCQRSIWSGSFSLLKSNESPDATTEENVNEKKTIENGEVRVEGSKCKLNDGQNKDLDEPPNKKRKISFIIKTGEPFDPLFEHRPWCLWIDKGIEEYTVTADVNKLNSPLKVCDIPGWKIFRKSLLKNISDFQNQEICSPSREQIRNVKTLLETWTDAV